MPVYDLNIDSPYMSGTGLGYVGAANPMAALSDASDLSYVRVEIAGWASGYTLADPSSPAGRLCSIGLVVRNSTARAGAAGAQLFSVGGSWGVTLICPTGTSIVNSEILAYQGQDPDSSAFVSSLTPLANNLVIVFFDTSADRSAMFYKALGRLYYLPNVSCGTPSAPTGTVTTTQMPACTVPLSLLVESWQLPSGRPRFLTGGDVEFAIYRSADAPGAAPPATPGPVWTVKTRFAESTVGTRTPSISATPDVSLPNGTYVVFARASRDLMSGPRLNWSAWVKSAAWTQNLTLPTAPTLTPAADSANQRMALSVNCPTTTGYDSATGILELQRLVGGVWRDVRGLGSIAIAIDSTVAIGYDYEFERAATNTYRSRVSMVLTADSIRYYSAWAQVTATGPAVTGWNLKTVEVPASNWIAAGVNPDPAEEPQRSAAVFEPFGRDRPVVVYGTVGGVGGALQIECRSAAEIALADALSEYAGPVLLETAFGDAKYIAVTKCSWTRQGTLAGPRRTLAVTYTEIACDLPTDAT